jgi:hypothetical protein
MARMITTRASSKDSDQSSSDPVSVLEQDESPPTAVTRNQRVGFIRPKDHRPSSQQRKPG